MSDNDDELEEDELGMPGDSGESFKGLDGATTVEMRRSASFGLAKFGRFVERVDCVRTGGCWVFARDWVIVFVDGVLDNGGADSNKYSSSSC